MSADFSKSARAQRTLTMAPLWGGERFTQESAPPLRSISVLAMKKPSPRPPDSGSAVARPLPRLVT
jgi:hypothetical protein